MTCNQPSQVASWQASIGVLDCLSERQQRQERWHTAGSYMCRIGGEGWLAKGRHTARPGPAAAPAAAQCPSHPAGQPAGLLRPWAVRRPLKNGQLLVCSATAAASLPCQWGRCRTRQCLLQLLSAAAAAPGPAACMPTVTGSAWPSCVVIIGRPAYLMRCCSHTA